MFQNHYLSLQGDKLSGSKVLKHSRFSFNNENQRYKPRLFFLKSRNHEIH